MKRMMILAIAALGAMASSAPAGFTYNVSQSVVNGEPGGTGNVTVTGTITVDMLGTLSSASDITGYSLTLSSSRNPSYTMDSSDASISFFNVTLTATATSLSVNFPILTSTNPSSGFAFTSQSAHNIGYSYTSVYNPVSTVAFEELANQPTISSPLDQGANFLPSSGTYLVGTMTPTISTPEPSSFALLTMAGVMVSGFVARSRRRTRAS